MKIKSHQISAAEANELREKATTVTQRIPKCQLLQLLKQVPPQSYIYFYYFENLVEGFPESLIIASYELAGEAPSNLANPGKVEFLGYTNKKGDINIHNISANEANTLRKKDLPIQKISYSDLSKLLKQVPEIGCVYFSYSKTLIDGYPSSVIIAYTEFESSGYSSKIDPSDVEFLDFTNIHPPEMK